MLLTVALNTITFNPVVKWPRFLNSDHWPYITEMGSCLNSHFKCLGFHTSTHDKGFTSQLVLAFLPIMPGSRYIAEKLLKVVINNSIQTLEAMFTSKKWMLLNCFEIIHVMSTDS